MSEPRPDPVTDIFARHGLRCTRQRRALFEALRATKAHPSADQLHHDVATRFRGMSLATVYNTLEAFVDAGLAMKLPGANGSARYDATVLDHVHACCEDCGAMLDVPDQVSQRILERITPDLLTRIQAELGFTVTAVRIELRGRCVRADKEHGASRKSGRAAR